MKKITIIGGDRRLIITKKLLEEYGYKTDTLGLFENDSGTPENSDVLLFPVPTTRDGETVNCPLTNRVFKLSNFKKFKGRLFLTANYDFSGQNCTDYCKTDTYAYLNAVPTAEGAISYAISETPFTLWKSRVLIIGYGRTGKVLCDRLKSFKCDLTVSARKQSDFALLDIAGIKHRHTSLLDSEDLNYDIIFNTVDVTVFDKNLSQLTSSLIIDLSSKGCINCEKAKGMGIKYKKFPAVPAKTAPETAGKILAYTVNQIIKGEKL